LSFVVPAKHSAPVAIEEDMVAVGMRVCLCVVFSPMVLWKVGGPAVGFGVSRRIGVGESLE
jgi:hypothetical protein